MPLSSEQPGLRLVTASKNQTFNSSIVRVHGIGQHVEFVLDDQAPLWVVEQGLREYMLRTDGRFAGGTVSVNLGQRLLNADEVESIIRILRDEFGLNVAGVWCGVEALAKLCQPAIPTPCTTSSTSPISTIPRPKRPQVWETTLTRDTLLIKQTCRSGVTMHHNGDVVVLGDVNPGAEVTASGDIVVFSRLRGVAHAGANGDDSRVIISLSIEALQLRIGKYIGIGSSDGHKGQSITYRPQIAFIKGDNIVIEPYTSKFRWR